MPKTNWLALMLQLFPVVLQGVVTAETVLGSQPGATKKEVLLSSVVAAAKVGGDVEDDHVKAISALTDSIVGALNLAGVFKKDTPK